MNKINIALLALVLLAAAGCKDPYEVELRPSEKSLLVVEGFLNKGAKTTIRLSRTQLLTDRNQLKPELRAQLTVEGKDNTALPLADRGGGTYEASQLNLQVGKEYRLHIRTAAGKEYLSDYVTLKANPPIDSVSWRWENDGVHIYTTTHDPNNATHYYQWTYEETWEQRSVFFASWKKGSPRTVVKRKLPEEDVSVCWRTINSTSILLGSSAKLASDVIFERPMLLIPTANERLAFRYSVLVRQWALDKDAYEYLDLMKKNSESMGSIFDAQPSEIHGNIHSVSDPEESVVGFWAASEVQEKRLFISRLQVRDWGYYMFCETRLVLNNPDSIEMFLGDDNQPYEAKYSEFNPNVITHWYASDAKCVDCTSRGGTTQKPSFW